MSLLRLAVLGAPEVFHDGSRLTFSLRKAQALLLYLAVEGVMHSRSKLASFLWPDSEPHAARSALRPALPLLRDLSDESSQLQSSRPTLTRWLALDPPSAEAPRRLMRVHLAGSDAVAALQVYAPLRAHLAEELQAHPSAQTVALAEHVHATLADSRGSRTARSSPTMVESRPPSEVVAPLVGRPAAFTQLGGSLRQARPGRPHRRPLAGRAALA